VKARIGSLFTGYGGLDRAVTAHYGGSVAWHSEIDPAASKLLARHHPDIPNLGDITAIDWATVEPVDIITGGFPCQDLSVAGHRAGLTDGTRSGLWLHMARAIEVLEPAVVVIENVGGIRSASAHSDLERDCWCVGGAGGGPVLRALGTVLGSLAGLGFDARWGSVRASDAGAPHRRERVFIVAAHPGRGPQQGLAQQAWRLPVAAERPHLRREEGHGPVTILPTPRVSGMASSGATEHIRRQVERKGYKSRIEEAIALLPTPRASDGPQGGPGQRNGRGQADSLPAIARLLPTPTAQASKHGPGTTDRGVGTPDDANLWTVVDRHRGAFGPYQAAIARWETILGRPAPPPTERNSTGGTVLSPAFVEHMMGLPAGWVTALPIPRTAQLKLLGNGVVPQQAALALQLLDEL